MQPAALQTKILHFHKKGISPPLSAVTGVALSLQHEMQPVPLQSFAKSLHRFPGGLVYIGRSEKRLLSYPGSPPPQTIL